MHVTLATAQIPSLTLDCREDDGWQELTNEADLGDFRHAFSSLNEMQ